MDGSRPHSYRLAYEMHAPLDRVEGGRHCVPEDHAHRISSAINELLQTLV